MRRVTSNKNHLDQLMARCGAWRSVLDLSQDFALGPFTLRGTGVPRAAVVRRGPQSVELLSNGKWAGTHRELRELLQLVRDEEEYCHQLATADNRRRQSAAAIWSGLELVP